MAAFPLMNSQRRNELLTHFFDIQKEIVDTLVDYLVPLYRYFAQQLEQRNLENATEETAESTASNTRISRLKTSQLKAIAKMLMDIKIAFEAAHWDQIDQLRVQLREALLGFDYALISTIASKDYTQPAQVFILKEKESRDAIAKLRALLRQGDEDRDDLFKGNWRLVMEIARRFEAFGSKLDLDEMIQEGNSGLLAAIDKFNPALQLQLSTLAANWIQAKIRRAMDNMSETIRTPVYKRQRKKLVAKAEMELLMQAASSKDTDNNQVLTTGAEKLFGRQIDDKEIAKRTGLDVEEVSELRRLYPETVSINATVDGSDDSNAKEQGDLITYKEAEMPQTDQADKNLFFSLLTRLVDDLDLEQQVVLSCLNGLPIRKEKLKELVTHRWETLMSRGASMLRQPNSMTPNKALIQVFK